MVSWVNTKGLGEEAGSELLKLMTNKEFGVREPAHLLNLKDMHMEELKSSLPLAQQSIFIQAVEDLKVHTYVCNMHVAAWSGGHNTRSPILPPTRLPTRTFVYTTILAVISSNVSEFSYN